MVSSIVSGEADPYRLEFVPLSHRCTLSRVRDGVTTFCSRPFEKVRLHQVGGEWKLYFPQNRLWISCGGFFEGQVRQLTDTSPPPPSPRIGQAGSSTEVRSPGEPTVSPRRALSFQPPEASPDSEPNGESSIALDAPPTGPPNCPICLLELIAETDPEDVEALECGHTMHTRCLNTYCETAGLPKREACPFRCHASVSRTADFGGARARPLLVRISEEGGEEESADDQAAEKVKW